MRRKIGDIFIFLLVLFLLCTVLFPVRGGKSGSAYANLTTSQIIFKNGSCANLPPSAATGEPMYCGPDGGWHFYIGTGSGKQEFGQQGPAGPTGPAGYSPVIGADYFDGRPGAPPLFCNISGGIRAITYDQTGLNPQPSMQPYGVQVWSGSDRVTPIRQIWWTGPSPHQVFGSGSNPVFTASVMSTYSANRANNFVAVQATISSASVYGGKRYCTTGTPIAVTQIGATGLQGPPGQNATVDQPSVLSALAQPGGNPISRQPLSPQTNSTSMYETHNLSPGNTTWFVSGDGTMSFIDVNGYVWLKINPTTQAIEARDTSNLLRLAMTRQGNITTYHTDGTKPIFQVQSSVVVIQ